MQILQQLALSASIRGFRKDLSMKLKFDANFPYQHEAVNPEFDPYLKRRRAKQDKEKTRAPSRAAEAQARACHAEATRRRGQLLERRLVIVTA